MGRKGKVGLGSVKERECVGERGWSVGRENAWLSEVGGGRGKECLGLGGRLEGTYERGSLVDGGKEVGRGAEGHTGVNVGTGTWWEGARRGGEGEGMPG